jgi:glycosyltransferase involved in cell wall biosynthesis
MPAYNAGRFLAPAVESILAQTWRNFEFIVIDDGSTDGTRERLAAYAERDPRIRFCPNAENLGVVRTLNRGISLARAPWIARMDADDLSRPDRLERQLAAAARQPAAGWVTSPFDVIDEHDRLVPGWRGICFQQELLPFFLLFYNRLNAHGQVMYSTSLVRSLGGYDERFPLSEATELWLRLVRAAPCAVVRQPLYAWRAHNPNSVSRQRSFRYADASLQACRDEIARTCNLSLERDQVIALRDFWLRRDEQGCNWNEVARLLLEIGGCYRPPRPVANWAARVRAAIASGWISHALLQLKHHNRRLAREHFMRAHRAAGGRLMTALTHFALEVAAVRGQVTRRA